MASTKSLANKAHYETMARSPKPAAPEEAIELNDIHWTALTAEPRGVDYFEVDADGVAAMWIVPKGAAHDRVVLYAHGGGFVSGSIYTHRKMVGHLAKAAGCRALIFAYQYAHQAKLPAQVETMLHVHSWLRRQAISPDRIAMAGDSCGAILVFGTLQRLRAEGEPLPAAVMILSGWLDLALTGTSYERNRGKDIFFERSAVQWLVTNILGDHDPRDSYVSPLYANLSAFPPIYLQAGSDETLVDESRMFAERAKRAGLEVRLDVFPEMLHSFQMMAGRAPEADDAIARLGDWVRPKLGLPSRGHTRGDDA